MSAPATPSDSEELARRFARLVHAVVEKVGGETIESETANEVFEHLRTRFAGESLYTGAVRETVRLLGADRDGDPAGHLDEAVWDQLATNSLDDEEREVHLHHAKSCSDCGRVWHGVSTLKEEAEARQLIPRRPGLRPWWQQPKVVLVVAILMLLAVAAFFITLGTDS